MINRARIKALKREVADLKAKQQGLSDLADAARKHWQEICDEVRRANDAVLEAERALKLAQPLGKRLLALLKESSDPRGFYIPSYLNQPQRSHDFHELKSLNLVSVVENVVRITDAGLTKLAEDSES